MSRKPTALRSRDLHQRVFGTHRIALLDVLAEHHLLIEVDWKSPPDEIIFQLRTLRTVPAGQPQLWAWADEAPSDMRPVDVFYQTNQDVQEFGTTLVVLNYGYQVSTHGDCANSPPSLVSLPCSSRSRATPQNR